jgi:hypothetical protein
MWIFTLSNTWRGRGPVGRWGVSVLKVLGVQLDGQPARIQGVCGCPFGGYLTASRSVHPEPLRGPGRLSELVLVLHGCEGRVATRRPSSTSSERRLARFGGLRLRREMSLMPPPMYCNRRLGASAGLAMASLPTPYLVTVMGPGLCLVATEDLHSIDAFFSSTLPAAQQSPHRP